jgi:hypothetical protein
MFYFATPFWYDGTNNLMVDFSFNNDSYSADGQCRATPRAQTRTISFHTDSAFGDPLAWGGSQPPPVPSKLIPNIRLLMEVPVEVTPSTSGQFVQGVWTGEITLATPENNIVLRAVDDGGHIGLSAPLAVQQQNGMDPQGRAGVLRITGFRVSNNGAVISFSSESGKTYRVEWADTPTGGTWTGLADLPGTGQVIQIPDPTLGQASRYYRVLLLP